ncbi:MAG: adenine phosphoribosyltransferase [Thermotogae bacterium]|nr:MAG: adenine phosphoribosyltransferase [Thermotogota bacterium]
MEKDLKRWIRDIPNFPVEGIIYRDITPLLKDPQAFRYAVSQMIERIKDLDFKTIVAPEARGFVFASTIAYELGKGFVPVRKPGKLPYETVYIRCTLEYGDAELHVHKDAIERGDSVLIVDDVLATGGTVNAIARLMEKQGGRVVGILALIELSYLNPRNRLKNYRVESVLVY